MNKKNNSYPYPNIIIFQLWLAFLLLFLALIPLGDLYNSFWFWVYFFSMIFLLLADIVILILSIFLWRNTPFFIDEKGILWKKNNLYLWKDVETIRLKKIITTVGGPLIILSIEFFNNKSICFQWTELFHKKVKTLCPDKEFLLKYDKVVSEFHIEW